MVNAPRVRKICLLTAGVFGTRKQKKNCFICINLVSKMHLWFAWEMQQVHLLEGLGTCRDGSTSALYKKALVLAPCYLSSGNTVDNTLALWTKMFCTCKWQCSMPYLLYTSVAKGDVFLYLPSLSLACFKLFTHGDLSEHSSAQHAEHSNSSKHDTYCSVQASYLIVFLFIFCC